MPCSSIHINLLEPDSSVLHRQIKYVCNTACSPLRLDERHSDLGVCFLRERDVFEALYEEIGEMLGFQTRTEAVARAQIAVEKRLRHKLLPATANPVANVKKGKAFDGQALRLLLHARIADQFEKPALEKNPLRQAGPLLTWWEDRRYAGTVLDGFSVSMRAAETVIADIAVVPKEMVKAKGNPNWRNTHAMKCALPAYQKGCDTLEEAEARRAQYKTLYTEQFSLVYDRARTMVIAPLKDYSRPHIEGLLDAIAEEMERRKNGPDAVPVNIMLATDDPYLYPLIRKYLFERKGQLAAAVPLPIEHFELKRGGEVRISDVRPDRYEEALLLLSMLAEKSSAPWRVVSEPGSEGKTLFLRERTGGEFIEECLMSPQKLEARKREACDALEALLKPLLAQVGNPANGDRAHFQRLLASMKHRVRTGKRMTDACATQEGQQGAMTKTAQATSTSSTGAMTVGTGTNPEKPMDKTIQPHSALPEIFLDLGSDDEEE
jgi:hypothetical protein